MRTHLLPSRSCSTARRLLRPKSAQATLWESEDDLEFGRTGPRATSGRRRRYELDVAPAPALLPSTTSQSRHEQARVQRSLEALERALVDLCLAEMVAAEVQWRLKTVGKLVGKTSGLGTWYSGHERRAGAGLMGCCCSS